MITIFSEKKEVRNNAMPSQMKDDIGKESIISQSLTGMRELVKKNLDGVKNIDWKTKEHK